MNRQITAHEVVSIAYTNLYRLENVNSTFAQIATAIEERMQGLNPSEQRYIESQDIKVEHYHLVARLLRLLTNSVQTLQKGRVGLSEEQRLAILNAPRVMRRAEQMLSMLTGQHVVRPTIQKLLGSRLQKLAEQALYEITYSRYNLSFLFSPVFCEMLQEYSKLLEEQHEVAMKRAAAQAHKPTIAVIGINPLHLINKRFTTVH